MKGLAIVGISCKFPGADNHNIFWENLISKKSSISEVPAERWNWKDFDGEIFEENKTYCRWGGFVGDVDKFDNDFFNISGLEAERMDPQQRLFLEHSWSCIEDSGYDPSSLSGSKTGVFAGVSTTDYQSLVLRHHPPVEAQTVSGLASSLLANRVSYFFNFRGPSLPVDTACSSSLIALHQAWDAIENGYCDSAIVGGVNLMLSPEPHISFSKAGMLSPTGACKSFDAEADGYVRGEGVGVIYVKKLEDAIKANDNIYCVVKGSSTNHGGKVHNLTSPNPYAQAQVISDGLTRADISPDKLTYIEAHGTGTPLGDPIEILGLKKAFTNMSRKFEIEFDENPFCGLGTVKTNIGHLEAAAGIAGIIKTALCLKNRKLPALQNFNNLNPKIKIEDTPFYFVTENREWQTEHSADEPRTAGVSSFGFGGANAFVVLQEYISDEKEGSEGASANGSYTFLFSGNGESSLKQNVLVQKNFIENVLTDEMLADYSYTLERGRRHFTNRLAIRCSSRLELVQQIESYLEKDDLSAVEVSDSDLKEWVEGGEIRWDAPVSGRKISIPTYQFSDKRHWLELREEVKEEETGEETVLHKEITTEEFEELWYKAVAGEDFELEADLTELDSLSLIGLSLSIQKKYNISLDWALLTEKYNTPEKIIDYINEHLENVKEGGKEEAKIAESEDIIEEMTDLLSICKPERWFYPREKNDLPMCFIITSMRHGSSLTSFILNANPAIYAPQGLYLLPFTNLQERAEVLKKQILFLEEGLINTVEDLWQVSKEEANGIIEQWTEERLPVVEVYRKIQEKCYPRILVDRGTIYGLDINILERARKSFSNVKFIHLLRHPSSVFKSGTLLLKKTALLKRMITQEDFENPLLDKKLQFFLDRMWSETHMNFHNFKKTISEDSSYQLKFENLVGSPKEEMENICRFLDVPFSDFMLNPYDVEENVRLHNKKGESGISTIDPKVMTRTQIESKNSDNWKKYIPKWPVTTETKYFMGKFSYDIVEEKEDYSELIEPVNEGTSDRSILVIPGFGGKLDAFKRLFSDTDLKVDGLKIPEYAPFDSIQNLAGFYIAKDKLLSGYNIIVGYSLGALVAWEISQALLETGHSLDKLILIDRNPYNPLEELYVKDLSKIRKEMGDSYDNGNHNTAVIEGLINYGILFLNFSEKRCAENVRQLMDVEQDKSKLISTFISHNENGIIMESELERFVGLFMLTRKMLENYKSTDSRIDSPEGVYFQPEETEQNPIPANMKRVIVKDCDHFSIINRDKIKELLLPYLL